MEGESFWSVLPMHANEFNTDYYSVSLLSDK